jgi:hypothetical protein
MCISDEALPCVPATVSGRWRSWRVSNQESITDKYTAQLADELETRQWVERVELGFDLGSNIGANGAKPKLFPARQNAA